MTFVRNKTPWWEPGEGRTRRRFWTPDKMFVFVSMLERGMSDQGIADHFGTTVNAVMLQRKRSRISARSKQLLSARHVARLMGIGCAKTVVRWIEQGYLDGRRGQTWGPYRQWYITYDALFAFLANKRYWHLWDPERIVDDYLRTSVAHTRPPERYLTTGQVAKRLYVEHTTVSNWIRSGRLPAAKHGPNWKVAESDLDGFVPPNQRSRLGVPRRHYSEFEDRLILNARRHGIGYTEIARQLNRTVGSVYGRYHRLTERRVAS